MSTTESTALQGVLPITTAEAGKRCRRCDQVKPRSDFHANPSTKDRLHSYCAPCARQSKHESYERWTPDQRRLHRDRVLRMRYGIGVDDVIALYEEQRGCCAICRQPGERPAVDTKRTPNAVDVLAIDHDHGTGNVRGLLCRSCNLALGYFKDSVATMQTAITYVTEKGK